MARYGATNLSLADDTGGQSADGRDDLAQLLRDQERRQ